MDSVAAIDNFILQMMQRCRNRRGRGEAGTGSCPERTLGHAPLLQAQLRHHQLLVERRMFGEEKKRVIREEASMRNKMSMYRRTEAKQSSFHWYSPSTRRQSKSWGERGWWCLSLTNPLREEIKLMYCPGKIGAQHQHQRNLIVGGLSEENAFIFYLI